MKTDNKTAVDKLEKDLQSSKDGQHKQLRETHRERKEKESNKQLVKETKVENDRLKN